ncbi:MAG TPA: branched-chain amino acid ABC transporter permease/ATP-binding protein [Acidimicrobiales bacterium]|nr:branched-chain amino acid ABC transporter permease/ATP-binding protein [Acidimicrobiales bacterium]
MGHASGPVLALAGWTISAGTLVTGLLTGLTYAVLAAGLVLVYRATSVVNFAHGEIGAFGAAILAKLVLDEHWNFFAALVVVLVVGGALGGAVELGVVRRLFRSPRLVLLVATIGVSQLVFVAQLLLPGIRRPAPYPSPLHREVSFGSVHLFSQHFMVLAFVPAVMVALTLFLNRTPYGVAIRAAADNPDRAELAGISTKRVSTLVWVLAGVLSTLSAVLIDPLHGTVVGLPAPALGPGLLLRALTAAMVGGMTSLPLALVGGVGVGVVEAVVFANVSNPGVVDALLFAAVLVLVLVRRSRVTDSATGWSVAARVSRVPPQLRTLWWPRHSRLAAGSTALLLAAVLPLAFSAPSRQYLFSQVLVYALLGISVTVLVGWAGQLSLGQYAFAGLGALLTVALVGRGMGFLVALAYATLAGVGAALAVGFPALRVRGLFLAITTLAFAVATNTWLLQLHGLSGGQGIVTLPRSTVLGFLDLRSQRSYYYLCLAVVALAAVAVSHLRTTGVGRAVIAVRSNERAAASFTISPALVKMMAFGLAGGLAALAGGLLAGLDVQVDTTSFRPDVSLQLVAMVVIGGMGSVAGAVLGAVYVVGLPALFNHSQTVGLLTSGIGLLVLLLYLPGGLMGVVQRAWESLLAGRALRRAKVAPPSPPPSSPPAPSIRVAEAVPAGPVGAPAVGNALDVGGVTVRFGGRLALDGVDLTARAGEILGLIGSNGAGKSTLMNAIGGYLPVTAGSIAIFGTPVDGLPPHERARLGMGRAFQDAGLFGDLTVRETVQLALEAHGRSELLPSLLALPPGRRTERWQRAESDHYIDFLGLGRYADASISDLSTGTRRIVEICCLVAQGARLLLLDEPTAGVAQRETEAFGPLIRSVQQELAATLVVIEHDLPLVMGISDRMYCLAAGRCIAEGPPDAVRSDPQVVAAYLGTDERAIARSGVTPGGRAGRRPPRRPTGAQV